MLRINPEYAIGKPRERDDRDVYPARRKPVPESCPACGDEANVKDYRKRMLFHVPVCEKPLPLEPAARRSVCPACDTTFTAEFPVSASSPTSRAETQERNPFSVRSHFRPVMRNSLIGVAKSGYCSADSSPPHPIASLRRKAIFT